MTKLQFIKIISIVGLLSIFLLQAIWLYNSYNLIKSDISVKSDDCLFEARNREIYHRLGSLTVVEETEFGDLPFEKKSGQLNDLEASLNEFLYESGSIISLQNLDSIYSSLLATANLKTKYSIYLINENDSIINSSNDINISSLGKIETKIIPLLPDNSLKLQASIQNPYTTIFERMGLLLILTVIIVIVVVFCMAYQIKMIIDQNKMAQIREDFANAIIHEMKTPLTSIIMGVNILLTGKLDGMHDKIKDYLKVIGKEGEKLLSLTDRVLNMTKLENKGVLLNKVNVRINSIINDLIDKFLIRDSKEIKFSTDIRVDTVYADQEYLSDAISNLIENAIKYSGDSVDIKITVENIDSFTHIKIRDDGFGIAHNDLVKIFEKYERGGAAKRSAKGGATGFGIGLSYVQEIAKAHKGTVEIESIKGKYSEFTLKIPTLIEEL